MDTIVQVISVSPRTTSKGRVIYDVKGADGSEFACWEAEVANAIAAAAPAGPMTLRYDEKRNGQYVNKNIRAFAPAGQQLGPDTGPSVGQGGGGYKGGKGGGMTEDDKKRIAKQGAHNAASTLIAALYTGAGPDAFDEAVAKLDALALHLYKHARSHEKKAEEPVNLVGTADGNGATNLITPQATTPQGVAQLVPGVQVGTTAVTQDAAAEAPDQPVDWD